ncbi:MAG: ABC transporter permease [Parachlamydiales bacterium]|jgi:oligopeptide transport system permease protein
MAFPLKNKSALFGLGLFGVLLALAFSVPYFSAYDSFKAHLENQNLPPSWNRPDGLPQPFFFGTDELGRDLFSRTFYGARLSLMVGLFASLIDLAVGSLFGALAAFFKGSLEELILRLCDVLHALPSFLVFIWLLLWLGPGFSTVILALTLTGWINTARITRAAAERILQADFILAAYAMGARRRRIIFKHLFPHLWGTMTAAMAMAVPSAIFSETFLSFLGLGLPPPAASLGVLLNDALDAFRYYPHRLLFPALVLFLVLLSLHLIGDALSQAFHPKEKLFAKAP